MNTTATSTTKTINSAETALSRYNANKKKHPDTLILVRAGSFYETFGDDAIDASHILDINLCRHIPANGDSVEIAGFPYHALDTYLPKLVRAGKRVAIIEDFEDINK